MRPLTVFAGMAICLLVTGCNQAKSPDEEGALDVPEWLSKESGGKSKGDGESDSLDSGSDVSKPEIQQVAAERLANNPRLQDEPRGELKLKLQPGEQFPLKKKVVTTLVQTASDGTQQEIRTELELLMAIQVEEIVAGRTRLSVRYMRVAFQQDMDGQKLVYRSTDPPSDVPVAARAYQGMVDDGFSFWIGEDNQISEVVGFREFLQRCLANVPAAQQKQVLLSMEASTDQNGISDFVDNTIGLLPFGKDVSPGQEWVRPRSIDRPVPMLIQCKYTLQDLTPAEAVVRISGEIIPSQTINKVVHAEQDDINVTVLGGSTSGQCTIFRDTGLPKDSYTERVVNMTVDLGHGQVFDQTKTVQTRVEAFPSLRHP